MKLTIGMPCYEDFKGVWATVQSARLQAPDAEIVVVDNKPDGEEGRLTAQFCRGAGVRYVPQPLPVGSATTKNRVFAEATGDVVVCVDSHVILEPGAVRAVLDYFADADPRDMLVGPMVYDDLRTVSTHCSDVWSGQMWGIWATDRNPDPFEVFASGCGFMAMTRGGWPTFSDKFRGFGAEEGYIHEKVRNLGGKVVCHPAARWVHCFGKPGGVKFPLTAWHRCRNYVIGLTELGIPLDRLRRHFVEGIDERVGSKHVPAPMDEIGWNLLTSDPSNPPEWASDTLNTTQGMVVQPVRTRAVELVPASAWNVVPVVHRERPIIEVLYDKAAKTPSDINEHCERLRQLASQADVVVEFGCRRGVSTVALLAGRPNRFITHDLSPPEPFVEVLAMAGQPTEFEYRQASSLDCEIPDCDLLFIDTVHTARQLRHELERHFAKVRRRIALHDTVTFGERGEDGGPGLLDAVDAFLKSDPRWFVASHAANNHGFTVLSKDPADRPPSPILLRPPSDGVGSRVEAVIAELGFGEMEGCNCKALVRQMNIWGPDGCRQNHGAIVEQLKKNGEKLGWAAKLKAGPRFLALGLNPLDPYGSVLSRGIKLAEEAAP